MVLLALLASSASMALLALYYKFSWQVHLIKRISYHIPYHTKYWNLNLESRFSSSSPSSPSDAIILVHDHIRCRHLCHCTLGCHCCCYHQCHYPCQTKVSSHSESREWHKHKESPRQTSLLRRQQDRPFPMQLHQ